jgi:hypothetical protein
MLAGLNRWRYGQTVLKQSNGVNTMHLRRKSYALVLSLLILGPFVWAGPADPDADKVPKFIQSGMDAYKSEGPEAAIKAWIKGSALEGSKDALTQANGLRQIGDYYGAYKAFEVISSRTISPSTRVFYLTLEFEKGPVFAKFVIYRVAEDWVLVSFNFNTKPELILPSCP